MTIQITGCKIIGMATRIDLKDKKFGSLTPVERPVGNKKWTCLCDCGNSHSVTTSNLISGSVTSCGQCRGSEIDITGNRYGSLVAVKKTTRKLIGGRYRWLWLLACDCGKTTEVPLDYLYGNTTSCGCKKGNNLKGKRTSDIDYIVNSFMLSYKKRAKTKNIPYDLDLEFCKSIMILDCTYCGVSPREIHRKLIRSEYTAKLNGLDRVDSQRGYTKDNVTSCCPTCNTIKLDMSRDDFFTHIKRIIKYQEQL